MPRRRVILRRAADQIVAAARGKLEDLEKPPPSTEDELRSRVRLLVDLAYDLRELGIHQLSGMIPAESAAMRILEYLRLFVGQPVDGEELDVVSGISEYPRRIREWRVEHGWPIKTDGTRYILERGEPDGEEADLWKAMNSIRRTDASPRDRMLALFQRFPGRTLTTDQLQYVGENADMRRVRELRTELGWRIATKNTGRPDLKPGEYVLVDPDQMEEHDRHIPDDVIVQVLNRDGTRCRKVGCGWHPRDRVQGDPRQYIEVHHVDWHVAGGSNQPENLVTLCNVHHRELHRERIDQTLFDAWVQRPAAN